MSMAVAALSARAGVTIEDTACTETSFPGFWEMIDEIRES
jgi:3-phosphoshikimate 1-carboxyvinyltransferase